MQSLSPNLANIPVSLSKPSPGMAWQAEDSLLARMSVIRNVYRKETPSLEIQLLSCPHFFFQSRSGLGVICPLYRGERPCCAPPPEEQDNPSDFLLKSHSTICAACSAPFQYLMLKLFACENIAAHISHLHSFRLYQGNHFILQLKATLARSSLKERTHL